MKPQDVNPKKFEVQKIIYNSDHFSIAVGIGDGGNEYQSSSKRFAMRWDGHTDEEMGFPTSNGHPMWFQLPNDIATVIKVLIENSNMDIK